MTSTIDVFISYAHPDKPVADSVCAILEGRGLRCWIAPRDVPPGREYAEAIIEAIRGCRAMVLVFSSRSDASPQVRREVERASSKNIPVIPLRIEDVRMSGSMEYYLSDRHWLDALSPPLEPHVLKLAETIHALPRGAPGTAGTAGLPGPVAPAGAGTGSASGRLRPSFLLLSAAAIAALTVAGLLLRRTAPAPPPGGSAASAAPAWVDQGSGPVRAGDREVFQGVGVAPGIRNRPLAVSAAGERARAEIAKTINAFLMALISDYLASITPVVADRSNEEQAVSRNLKDFARHLLSDAVIVDHWQDSSDGTMYALCTLELDAFRKQLDDCREFDPRLLDYLRTHAGSAFAEMRAGAPGR